MEASNVSGIVLMQDNQLTGTTEHILSMIYVLMFAHMTTAEIPISSTIIVEIGLLMRIQHTEKFGVAPSIPLKFSPI